MDSCARRTESCSGAHLVALLGGKTIVMIDGVPCPRYVEPYTKERSIKTTGSAFAEAYKFTDQDTPEDRERFQGMSKLEVANARQADLASQRSDLKALEFFYDRTIGKPKQVTENMNLTMSLTEWVTTQPQPTGDELVIDIMATTREYTEQNQAQSLQNTQKDIGDMTPDEISELLGDV